MIDPKTAKRGLGLVFTTLLLDVMGASVIAVSSGLCLAALAALCCVRTSRPDQP